MNLNPKEVGHRIRSIRKEKGLTMEEFGKLIGKVKKSAVGNWERGDNLPNNERLKRIAELGETTVDFILYGSLDGYARNLINELEKELKEDGSITDKVAASIISDIENRLFPEYFPPNYKNRESLEKQFNDYKKSAIELWTNSERIDLEIASRIRSLITSDIYGNLDYFYEETYNKDGKKGEKVSTRADKIVKRFDNLDRFQREYIDAFRYLDDEKVVKESAKKIVEEIVKEIGKEESCAELVEETDNELDKLEKSAKTDNELDEIESYVVLIKKIVKELNKMEIHTRIVKEIISELNGIEKFINIVKELDKIESYTDRLKNLNGVY